MLDSAGLPIDKTLLPDAVQSPLVDDAMQPKEGADGYPVKVPISCPTFDISMQMLVGSFECGRGLSYSTVTNSPCLMNTFLDSSRLGSLTRSRNSERSGQRKSMGSSWRL